MNPIFPPEIIKASVESHFSRFSKNSRLIYFVVLLVFCLVIVSMFFIKTEITVQGRGIFRSSSESVSIVSPVVAEVKKTVLRENQSVRKGDTLVWLDYEKIEKRIVHIENLILENEAYLNDISRMLEYKYSALETDLFCSTHSSYRQKLKEYNLNIGLQEKVYSRAKQLFDKQVIPIAELEEKEFALHKIREDLKNYIQSTRNEWESLAVSYRLENKKYMSEIVNLQNDKKNFIITAPESGHITNYSGIKVGSFVTTGESIAEISPDGEILAEHLVSPKDIGYLQVYMPVIFQIDAYNYNQWGLASGRIIEISNEIYVVNNQPFFKVRSSLDQSHLSLKNGYKGSLKKGLTVTARFKVTKRTLAQLLFDKTDDWLNPKIISE
ncbi:HlyD family efflux transporter periplasmic adaptor subunit [Maribellus luteus]|uniref:HlyD family efflux transporter periplasmic adaptor subunit n=1 Tax=Maribellus luteus TaxID=2305463 RepID=A0A399STP7_9BACT|nr:HlyD family efflux transporter periplasmic adaptor subunit [Maribellus luteus]RIJ46174.1 HlyD family efflux transporter periplasmic adaptor subunit [Maribellus luteus]